MGSIRVDKDISEAYRSGRLPGVECEELQGLRKLKAKADSAATTYKCHKKRHAELEAKVPEPKTDEPSEPATT